MLDHALLILFAGGALVFMLAALVLMPSWPGGLARAAVAVARSTTAMAGAETMTVEDRIRDISRLAGQHPTAAALGELITVDGAGTWPPRANHAHATWPPPLQPYRDAYEQLAPLLPTANASLDDDANRARIAAFRARLWAQLHDQVDLAAVDRLLEAAIAGGRWDVLSRETLNGFYSCVAWCRHAYRWATVPVVKVAQFETELDLPAELVVPWERLQDHFGCESPSGNATSSLVLNFDGEGRYTHRINSGLSELVTSSEEAFGRIFLEVEARALPMYHEMVRAIMSHDRGDLAGCETHVARLGRHLRPLLSSYYDRVHDRTISRSVWLSHVQGFYGWGIYHAVDRADGGAGKEMVQFDGLSGNQALLFQVLDGFLGLPPYLSDRDRALNMPARQRAFADAVRKFSFRHRLGEGTREEGIAAGCDEIVKRLRVFRTAHRTRALAYLSQPAPERVPMTAGKSLLDVADSADQGLEYLDGFMLRRLAQTA